jgi:hypothetical protein
MRTKTKSTSSASVSQRSRFSNPNPVLPQPFSLPPRTNRLLIISLKEEGLTNNNIVKVNLSISKSQPLAAITNSWTMKSCTFDNGNNIVRTRRVARVPGAVNHGTIISILEAALAIANDITHEQGESQEGRRRTRNGSKGPSASSGDHKGATQ